ncbi:MAG TPA: hypothetical protein VF609_03265 [Flavisolibacter sp.]
MSVEPYRDKPENSRLYHSIAHVQTTMAQMALNVHHTASPYSLLLSVFDGDGWEILPFNES